MHYKEGETIRLKSETGDFTLIKEKKPGFYIVTDEYGFEHIVTESELVKIHAEDIPLSVPYSQIIAQKTQEDKVYKSKSKSSRKIETPMIDLHIENLLEFHGNMSNSEILQHQMMVFRGFYKSKKSDGFRKIIAIHGVGEGVLRTEIVHFLHGQDNVDYHDADYQRFGGGATEIVF